MNGKIYFEDEAALARFLKEFAGATACFNVLPSGSGYELEFSGGY
jgi:hypothetical protein